LEINPFHFTENLEVWLFKPGKARCSESSTRILVMLRQQRRLYLLKRPLHFLRKENPMSETKLQSGQIQATDLAQPSETMSPKKSRHKTRHPQVMLPTKPPVAIRSLWEWANPAQKEQAHQTAVALMEYWLGQSSKQEIATRLNVPMLRVWQMSQQAISGMVVGLLNPPKVRTKKAAMSIRPEDDPKLLQRRIQELEKQVATQHRLIVILREMPASRDALLLREKVVKQTELQATELLEKNATRAKKAKRAPRQSQQTQTTLSQGDGHESGPLPGGGTEGSPPRKRGALPGR
jgi:hypothetical protein